MIGNAAAWDFENLVSMISYAKMLHTAYLPPAQRVRVFCSPSTFSRKVPLELGDRSARSTSPVTACRPEEILDVANFVQEASIAGSIRFRHRGLGRFGLRRCGILTVDMLEQSL